MMEIKRLHRRKIKKDEALSSCLNEFFNSESSFMQRVRGIKALIQSLRNHFPQERIFEGYDHLLRTALPCFENIYNQSQALACNQDLLLEDKIGRLERLYSDEMYYRHLTRLIFLFPEFEEWGGEIEFARCMGEARLFPLESVEEASNHYSPHVFLRQLYQLESFVDQFSFYVSDLQVDTMEGVVLKNIKEVRVRLNRGRLIVEIDRLFNEQSRDDHRRAIQLFIEERLYLDKTLLDVSAKVNERYPIHFKTLAFTFFNQIEKIKLKLREKESRNLKKYQEELKERLRNLLEYSKEGGESSLVDFTTIELIAGVVLSEVPLVYSALQSDLDHMSDDKKLSLLKCFADFSQFMKDNE